MPKETILIVEDEAPIQELLQYNLERVKYTVHKLDSGEEVVSTAEKIQPDLILLDIMLPGMDGLEVCKLLKSTPPTAHIPIIMLTAMSDDADIVAGLELGADDYVTKPFSPRVLLARVKTALRHKKSPVKNESEHIHVHSIFIDLSRHKVLADEKEVALTYTEFKVLKLLANQPGRVFTRYQIVNEVHGEDYPVTDRSVDVQIVGLRKKLGNIGSVIETVRGIGYRLKEE
jgi:two-component system alkaline phosphatase synthesis response regulator PhoP